MDKDRLVDLNESKMVPIEQVLPFEGNVKMHSTPQIRKVMNSIAKYGWDQPIVVDSNMLVIKGHARLSAAIEIGLEEVPVIVNSSLSEEEVRAARIADNKVAESAWDTGLLWDEIINAHKAGDKFTDLGFDQKNMRNLFPDFDLASLGIEPTPTELARGIHTEDGSALDLNGNRDPTVSAVETFIEYFRGEDAYLRKMSMVDYLNSHDKILMGFSGGKDSLAALIWCLENCERDKIIPYYSNLGWGPDWPHGIVYVMLIEKLYGVKVFMAGPTDPYAPTRFHDLVLQHGYMEPYSCWYRDYVKIGNIKRFLKQEKLHPRYGINSVQILAIRWSESADRDRSYPDRGKIKYDGIHFASPIIAWSDVDVSLFLRDRDIKLHTAYEHANRMGCLVCPHSSKRDCVNLRKKFPLFFKQIMEWHARGARRKNGKIQKQHFTHSLTSIKELFETDPKPFGGVFSSLAMNSKDFEDYVEKKMGEPLPDRPYVNVPFDKDLHNFRNDLKPGALGEPIDIPEGTCSLTG